MSWFTGVSFPSLHLIKVSSTWTSHLSLKHQQSLIASVYVTSCLDYGANLYWILRDIQWDMLFSNKGTFDGSVWASAKWNIYGHSMTASLPLLEQSANINNRWVTPFFVVFLLLGYHFSKNNRCSLVTITSCWNPLSSQQYKIPQFSNFFSHPFWVYCFL